MKITVFTSNQPRHIHLIEALAKISDQVYAVQEGTTVFPGQIEDFYKKSEVMQRYFTNVIQAENEIFGDIQFTSSNVTQMLLKMGDLNKLPISTLAPALNSDYYIIFGSSYIKGPLIDFLVDQRAINIHMGVSPYYRGSSCNFWAMYDGRPDLVGATIHLLSKGLDSGDMLYHALPAIEASEPFTLGMKAVKSAHESLVDHLSKNTLRQIQPIKQEPSLEMRYTRNKDFNDVVALDYLNHLPTNEEVKQLLLNRQLSDFLSPYIPPTTP